MRCILTFIFILAIVPTATAAPARASQTNYTCGGMQQLEQFIDDTLRRTGYKKRFRRRIAGPLSKRITAEAARFKLDPLAMAAVALVETGFNPYVRGRYGGPGNWQNEAGVWQLIPGDSPVRAANKTVVGCRPGGRAARWWTKVWKYRYQGKKCLYPDVAKHRTNVGRFRRKELKNIYVGTWIAAFEMRRHIDGCKKRRPRGHRWHTPNWLKRWKRRHPSFVITKLERYLHYNWGSRQLPKSRYRYALFSRYERVLKGVCKRTHPSTTATLQASH